jgi:hypothetical protein
MDVRIGCQKEATYHFLHVTGVVCLTHIAAYIAA